MARFTPTPIISEYSAITAINANFSDISVLFDEMLDRYGDAANAMQSHIDMNHFKVHNLGDAVDSTDAPNYGQVLSLIAALQTSPASYLTFVTPQMFGAKANANATGTTGTDDALSLQAAIAYINSRGGGTLYIPVGNYLTTTYLTTCKNLRVCGEHPNASNIVTAMAGGGGGSSNFNLRNGSVFYSNWTSNSSTAVNLVIENLGIVCSNVANVGAALYDNGGSFIKLNDVRISGFKHSLVFDQSELVDVDLCDFESPTTSCVWLVNSADLKVGNSGEYTNRISINRSQLNAAATAYGILDDGGNSHAFENNNYNGCLTHIRAAGVTGLKISGGEFESAASRSIVFHNLSLAGSASGPCSAVWLGGGAEIVPTLGQNCVVAFSLGNIVIDSVYFGNTAVVKFAGTGNINAIMATNIFNAGGGATFDGLATNHYELSNTGVITNMPIQAASFKDSAGNQVVGTRGAAVADAAALTSVDGTNAAAAPTQAEFNAFVAEFNKLRTDLGATRTQLNLALARLRAATGHGLIA